MSLERQAGIAWQVLHEDQVITGARVREAFGAILARWAMHPCCVYCADADRAFIEWIAALPDDDPRIVTLAGYGRGIGGDGWDVIITHYADYYVGTDSFGTTAANIFRFCKLPAPASEQFDSVFNALLLDAVAAGFYSVADDLSQLVSG